MSDATTGEEFREEAENRSDLGNGSVVDKRESSEGGGKRDSGTSSGSEGSHQHSTQAPQGLAQGQGNRGPSQPSEEPSIDHGKINVTRHVEASPQGRYLRFEDKLGTGQYKVVYRSYDTSMGIEVAWNTVNIKNLPNQEKRRIMNEVRLLKDLEHKNLVQFHGSWVNREKEEVVFVTEIMQSGSLMDFIRKVEMIRWRVVKRWARQILRGVNYLHYQDPPIIHRDLKCDNIFINGAAGDIRIGDLGLSTSNTRSEKTMSVLGTPEFMAPELYEEFYTEKVDIYAFGMCMLEMVTKERPYSECVNAAQIYRKVTSRVLPSALDRVQNLRAREFIRVCLSPDPDKRPSAMELLDQPFLKDKNEDEDNTLVILDPLVVLAEGHAPDPAIAPPLVSGKGELAKMNPQLPGVSHPAQKGAPDLSTIAEAPTSSGSHGATPQAPTGTPTAGGSQGQCARLSSGRAGSSASSGQSEAANSSLGEFSVASAGDAPIRRRPSSNPAPMPDSGGNKFGGLGNEGSDYPEAGGERVNQPDASKHQATHGKPEGCEAMVDPEGAQFGAYKIPGNPPYESEDEEERDTDAGNQEGFLRGMPEDESAMPLLKLPEGRVRRSVDDDDDEAVSEDSSGDDHGYAPPEVPAPSSAQSPPHSSVDAYSAPAEITISAAYGPGAPSVPSVLPPPHPANIAAELFAPFSSAPRPLATGTTTGGPPTGGPAMQAPRPPTMAAPSSASPIVPAPRTPTSIAPKKPSTQPQQTSTNSTLASTQVFRQNALSSSPGANTTQAPRPATSAPLVVAPLMQAPRAPSVNTPAASTYFKTAPQALWPWSIASSFSDAPSMQAPLPPTTASLLSGAPSMQAPWPPPASAPQAVAPTISAPRPPIAESPVFHSSGGQRRSFSVPNTEGGTLGMMRGASTPGMVSPPTRSKFMRGSSLVSSTFHAVRGLVAPDQMSASSMAVLGSDPGFATPPVGPAIPLQRARSFSPVDHVSHEPLTAASEGFPAFPSAPTAPAPSFPAPKPPGKSLDSKDLDARVHRPSTGDVPWSVNGAGLGAPAVFGRGDRQPATPQQGDQEAQESLVVGVVAPCWVSTEIKIANLQGPEREIMKLVMHAYIDGRMQEVEFVFNLEEDHPDQVSSEMIRELGLSYEEHERISTMIKNLAEKARKRRIRRPSMTSSVNVGQGSHGATSLGSSGGEYPVSGGAEGADNDAISNLPSGFEQSSSDDEVDIEEDDEFRRRKLQHDKKRRQAEKAYEARLAALLTARNDRTDEHKRAQERYRKECDDFDKRFEKLQNEKDRRMRECLNELQGLEDGYRQRHRDAKHAKRHGTTGNLSAQMATLSVSQSPVDAAPTPSSYAQLRTVGHGPGQNHGQNFSEGGAPHGGRGHQGQLTDAGLDDPRLLSDHQAINFSQFHSNDGQMGASWSGNFREAVVAPASSTPLPQHHHHVHQHHQLHQQQHHHQGANIPPKTEEREQLGRDRLSTL